MKNDSATFSFIKVYHDKNVTKTFMINLMFDALTYHSQNIQIELKSI